MLDVIVRPEGRCITLVCDAGSEIADKIGRATAIFVSKAEISGWSDGNQFHIGTFTHAMAQAAALCAVAVFVEMEGPYIKNSREVPLHVNP